MIAEPFSATELPEAPICTEGAASVSVTATVSEVPEGGITTVLPTAPPPTTEEIAKLTLDVPSNVSLLVGVKVAVPVKEPAGIVISILVGILAV